jgi:hypothetical protein
MVAQAAMQAALLGHDWARRSTELPHILFARIAKAAPIAGWNTDDRKCAEFYMTLRYKTLM